VLYLLRNSSDRCWVKIVCSFFRPFGVCLYPVIPTHLIGGQSRTVTPSSTPSFGSLVLLRFTSRSTCVIPALKPRKAVRCGGCVGLSFGNFFIRERTRFVRLLGWNPREPCRGASYLR